MASAKEVISVRMTRMCICFSNARYSATVSATFGVIRRSTTGSFAMFKNITTWSRTPLSAIGGAEVFRHVVFDAHGSEHDGELLIGILSQGGLAHDLRRQLVVGKSVSGKDRQLLAADQGGQAINGRNAGTDVVSGIFPGHGI